MGDNDAQPIANESLSGSYRRSLVELLGGPLDGTRLSVERKSKYVRADMPRVTADPKDARVFRAIYVRTGPTSFQHQSTDIVTGD